MIFESAGARAAHVAGENIHELRVSTAELNALDAWARFPDISAPPAWVERLFGREPAVPDLEPDPDAGFAASTSAMDDGVR